MKHKSLSVLALALLISFQAVAGGLRVMSYNIRLGVANDGPNTWELRKAATTEMLRTIQPAVFGVQEAYTFQLEYIAETCPWYKFVGVGRDDGKDSGEHMSVVYDNRVLELLDWGTYWLSETPDVPSFGWDAACRRTATWVLFKVRKGGKKFFFVNTHLDHKGVVARREGLAMLHRRISAMNPDNYPMVLTGDFNVLPDNEGLTGIGQLMKSARFSAKKADAIGSYNGFGKAGESESAPTLDKAYDGLLPIDYIYYSGYKCKEFRVVNQTFAGVPYISDHYPVYADLK